MTNFVTQLRRRVPLATEEIIETTIPTPHRDGSMGRITHRYGLCRIVRWHVVEDTVFYHPRTGWPLMPFSTKLGSFWRRKDAIELLNSRRSKYEIALRELAHQHRDDIEPGSGVAIKPRKLPFTWSNDD